MIIHRWTLAACLALFISSAAADQYNARLDPLFERLQNAPDALSSSLIEQQIWRAWSEAPNEAAGQLMRRGTAAMNAGQLETALSNFDELIAAEPEFAEAWNKRATVHYLLGNYQQSIADIDHTLALEPRHFGALSGLGAIFAQLEQPQAAIRAFEAVLVLYPQSNSSKRNIERLEQSLQGRTL
ncbi:tetratricopeptide repeat protein [Saccharospirillum mangrovi]|uniref:tetratricopeptide repeat protein n=1 Tax=Saccharospirillum mangrovi TaxID=2161747 RepID=UPI000D3C94E3|nr:tetratricopeptide repeat protein [Saccharospirillum mangrovi]